MAASRASSSLPTTPPAQRTNLRVSQRPPTACRECSQRKVRCDKQTPCGRCVRLSRRCTREVVRITKSLSLHRDEIRFLWALRARLLANPTGTGGGHDVHHDAIADIDARIRLLEHGKTANVSPEAEEDVAAQETLIQSSATTVEDDESGTYSTAAAGSSPRSSASTPVPPASAHPYSQGASHFLGSQQHRDNASSSLWQPPRAASGALKIQESTTNSRASILTGFEFLAWGRYSQACYPHRRCNCYQNRRYSELVSINCDAAWLGRQAMPVAVSLYGEDADALLLPPDVASNVVQFHMEHLRWHHNAFHGPTFLARCEQFWRTGTVDHPLWLALYFAVCSASLWTLLNNEPHRAAVTGDFAFDEALVERQFQAMVNVLYRENFLENLSLYAVQAIVISTRIAHNLDRTDLNAILVGAAVRIAHCLGLHKIVDPPPIPSASTSGAANSSGSDANFDWHERAEIETGKRVWLQLVIQDHFQIPYTDTYVIHPSQYITPLPKNCNDYDMVERGPGVATNSSYVRMLGRTAALIPPLLDGLGPMGARKSPADAYQHILACDRVMRANVAKIPEFLLRDDAGATAGNDIGGVPAPSWLPLARRTLAISAAEKIIMIHRPVLFESFQRGATAFQPTRTTCVAAATTILREHEQAIAAQTLSIWTHSAFCVTAAVVLGLELFHRADHTDATAHAQRQMMARAADRLRTRRADAIAQRGALLIDTLLAAEEDLVVRTMRAARGATVPGSASSGSSSAEAHRQAIINEMLGGHEIMARFLAVAPPKPDGSATNVTTASSTPLGQTMDLSPRGNLSSLSAASPSDPNMGMLLPSMDMDATAQDFDAWFNNVFAPVYDPLF